MSPAKSIRLKFLCALSMVGVTIIHALAQTTPAVAASSSSGPEIHDIHGLARLTFWERNGTPIIWSSVGGVVVLAVIVWLILRKKPVRQLTPYEIALRRLETARALPDEGQHQAFAIAATDAVRQYLETAYQMPAPERTTEEFLLEAASKIWMQGELAARLRHFLELCDLAKFAAQELGEAERGQLLKAAREFLDAAEKLRLLPVGTPNAQTTPVPPAPPPAMPPPAETTLSTP